MQLQDLVQRLDERLEIAAYRDHDPSVNGLQVGDESTPIDHVVGAVDAANATIDAAGDVGGDLLLVHHGLFWGGGEPLTRHRYERIRRLIEDDIAVYAAHLPLDGHQSVGNAAIISERLGVTDRSPFPNEELPIGCTGTFDNPKSPDELTAEMADIVGAGSDSIGMLGPIPDSIEEVAVVTGRGTDYIESAAAVGADLLITGEGKHEAYHEAADIGLGVVLAGHYATETFGVSAVLDIVADWGIETTFVDVPTGL